MANTLPKSFVPDTTPVPTSGASSGVLPKSFVPDAPAPTPAPGFGARVKSDYEERRKNQKEINAETIAGRQTVGEGFVQNIGEGIGLATDVAIEGAKSVLPKSVKKVIKGGIGLVGKALNPIVEPLAEAMSPNKIYEVSSKYHDEAFALYKQADAETDPAKQAKLRAEAADKTQFAKELEKGITDVEQSLGRKERNVSAGVNIGSVLPIGGGAKVTAPLVGRGLERVGLALEESGSKAINTARNKFAEELVAPVETKAVKEANVARTSEKGAGIFKSSVVTQPPEIQAARDAVAKIKDVSPKNTFQQNFNAIDSENTLKAAQLIADVRSNPFIIPKKESIARLNAVKDVLEKSPILVGDAQKTADKLLEGAINFINKNDGTGEGLLQARKDYDQWVLSQKPKAFDATAENAFTTANREIRNTLTALLDEKAPNVGVRNSLREQSALYTAMDSIAPKAANEANTAIGRTLQKAVKVLGLKNQAVQVIATVLGVGGLGAASTFAPIVAGVGIPAYVLYRAGKLVLDPRIRKAVGEILQQAGTKLQPSEKAVLENALKNYGSDTMNPQRGAITLPPLVSEGGLKARLPVQLSQKGESTYKPSVPQEDENGKVVFTKQFPFIARKFEIIKDQNKNENLKIYDKSSRASIEQGLKDGTVRFEPSETGGEYIYSQDKSFGATKELPPEKISHALLQLESSGGTNKASADPGEKKWLTGLTNIAIKELRRLGRLPAGFHVNNKASVLDASAEYFKLMQERHPELSPAEVYVDHYWTQSSNPKQRQKKIDQFNELTS